MRSFAYDEHYRPVIPVEIRVPLDVRREREDAWGLPSHPVRGPAIVDTGADLSAFDITAASRAGIKSFGHNTMYDFRSGRGVEVSYYEGEILIDGLGTFSVTATGLELRATQYVAVIGRDIMHRMVMIFNGPRREVTFHPRRR